MSIIIEKMEGRVEETRMVLKMKCGPPRIKDWGEGEAKEGLDNLKLGKAPGTDGVTAETMTCGGVVV